MDGGGGGAVEMGREKTANESHGREISIPSWLLCALHPPPAPPAPRFAVHMHPVKSLRLSPRAHDIIYHLLVVVSFHLVSFFFFALDKIKMVEWKFNRPNVSIFKAKMLVLVYLFFFGFKVFFF